MRNDKQYVKKTNAVITTLSCFSAYLKWECWLFIVDPHKDLSDYQLFAVITEHKLCPKAFIIFSL